MADDDLQGWWRVIAWEMEFQDTGERIAIHGDQPLGGALFAEGRIAAILTARERADKDAAALFGTMLAYSGAYRVEEGRLVIQVDVSWLPGWVGQEQVRRFELNGDALVLLTEWQAHPHFPGRSARGIVTLRRGPPA